MLFRHTNQGIAADEVVQDVSLGWDGKRDRSLLFTPPPSSPPPPPSPLSSCSLTPSFRWNGYNADSHAQVMQRFEALEGQRREERQKAIEEKLSTGFGAFSLSLSLFLSLVASVFLTSFPQEWFPKAWMKMMRKTTSATPQ